MIRPDNHIEPWKRELEQLAGLAGHYFNALVKVVPEALAMDLVRQWHTQEVQRMTARNLAVYRNEIREAPAPRP